MKLLVAILIGLVAPFNTFAGTDPYISEVALYSTPFCPRFWAEADGRNMNKARNQALFSLIGYTYGGSGNNFKLPDLRDQAPNGLRYCVAIQGQFPSRQ